MPPFLTKQLSEKKSNLRKVLEPHVIRVLSALIVILLFLLFYRISPFIFQTNDDLFLKMIVSGELTGTPDPHMFYIAYPTGLLLSGLYKLFPHFPWYGLFFCFTIGLTMTIILSTLLKLEEKLWTRLTTVFLFCLVSYGFLFLHIAELQFTTVTAIIVSLFLIEKLAYHRADWKTFSAYTEASEAIYDYEGYPDYDTYAEIYGELGITRSSYEAAAHHYCIILDPAVNQRTMETLEAIIKQERRLSLSELPAKIRQMVASFIERHLSYTDRPLNILVYCCYILFFICGILSGKRVVIRDILFLGVARMVIWSYLVFYGRLPSRVSQSVYMAEFVILLAIALKNQLWTVRQRRCHVFWIISMVILTFVCLRFGFPKARAVAWEASSRLHFSQSFVEIKDYFKEYPDNFYYLDMNSFGSFTEDALQSSVKECDNFLYMGSWIPNSPWYDTKYKKKGISDPAVALYENPNLYVVFMNTEGISYDYLIAFYAENYPGVRFDIADTVDVSNGLQFLILKGSAETK